MNPVVPRGKKWDEELHRKKKEIQHSAFLWVDGSWFVRFNVGHPVIVAQQFLFDLNGISMLGNAEQCYLVVVIVCLCDCLLVVYTLQFFHAFPFVLIVSLKNLTHTRQLTEARRTNKEHHMSSCARKLAVGAALIQTLLGQCSLQY